MNSKIGIHDYLLCAHAAVVGALCDPTVCGCNCHSLAYPFAKFMDKLLKTKTPIPPAFGYGPMAAYKTYKKRKVIKDEDDSSLADPDDDSIVP